MLTDQLEQILQSLLSDTTTTINVEYDTENEGTDRVLTITTSTLEETLTPEPEEEIEQEDSNDNSDNGDSGDSGDNDGFVPPSEPPAQDPPEPEPPIGEIPEPPSEPPGGFFNLGGE